MSVAKSKFLSVFQFFHEKDADDKNDLDRMRQIIKQEKAIGSVGFVEMLKKTFKVDFNIRKRERPKK